MLVPSVFWQTVIRTGRFQVRPEPGLVKLAIALSTSSNISLVGDGVLHGVYCEKREVVLPKKASHKRIMLSDGM